MEYGNDNRTSHTKKDTKQIYLTRCECKWDTLTILWHIWNMCVCVLMHIIAYSYLFVCHSLSHNINKKEHLLCLFTSVLACVWNKKEGKIFRHKKCMHAQWKGVGLSWESAIWTECKWMYCKFTRHFFIVSFKSVTMTKTTKDKISYYGKEAY